MQNPRTMYPQPDMPAQTQSFPGLEHQMDLKPDYGETSYKGNSKLEGMCALITGGDSGIGRAVALAYAREGCDVAISYLPEEQKDADETKAAVEKSGKKCLCLPGDITDPNHCKKLIQETVSQLGHLDILVNNAAFQGKSVDDFGKIDHDRVVKTFHTNIIAMFDLCREAIPHLKPGSSIINVGSIQAYKPGAHILDYACTKGAIVAFTKGLSQEVIEKGIRVNCVAPGPVWTPLIPASFDKEKVKEFGKSSPIGRPAQPAELAGPFVFLASKDASYVNAEILAVTGGQVSA